MRRVYDDYKFEPTKNAIMIALSRVQPGLVSRYSYGMYRADSSMIRTAVLNWLNRNGVMYRFGNTTHAHGIGNNNATEIIYIGNPNEQQICGLFHANEDLHSGCFCYVTDIDGDRKSSVITINGRGRERL